MISTENPGRVLIVDDDPSSVQVTSYALQSAGFCICSSSDARRALSTMENFDPDVVLLDLMMPGRDGFELCRLIRTNPKTSKVAVIMMTGMHDVRNRRRGIDCGANDYLTKPFETEDLILRVTNAANLKRAQIDLQSHREELYEVRNLQRNVLKEFMSRAHDFLETIEEKLQDWTEEDEEDVMPSEATGPVNVRAPGGKNGNGSDKQEKEPETREWTGPVDPSGAARAAAAAAAAAAS